MSGHTPGPWKDDSMQFGTGWRCVVNMPGGRSIDIADPRNRKTDDEDKANAALIASVPDLLVERDSLKLQIGELQKQAETNLAWFRKEAKEHEVTNRLLREVVDTAGPVLDELVKTNPYDRRDVRLPSKAETNFRKALEKASPDLRPKGEVNTCCPTCLQGGNCRICECHIGKPECYCQGQHNEFCPLHPKQKEKRKSEACFGCLSDEMPHNEFCQLKK